MNGRKAPVAGSGNRSLGGIGLEGHLSMHYIKLRFVIEDYLRYFY